METISQYTSAHAPHIEICKTNILRHERNLLKRQSRPPPESYHVPHGKTIYADHHNRKGSTHIRRKYIDNESPRREITRQITQSAETRFWKSFITFGSAGARV